MCILQGFSVGNKTEVAAKRGAYICKLHVLPYRRLSYTLPFLAQG